MKKIFLKATGLILIFVFTVLMLSACSAKESVEIASCELVKASNGVNGIFTVLSNEKAQIYNLTVTVKAFDENGDFIDSARGDYAMHVDPEHEATVTVSLPQNTKTAQAVSYTYVVDGTEKSGNFAQSKTAVFPSKTTADTKIDTREELAEKLIEDIEHQFMLQHYEAHGYYDEEKNQVIIASYATKTYADCSYAHSVDPTLYNELAKSIQQMSLTCYEEFENYNFKDVKVSIGFLSSDEKIMISATNGEIVDNFS